MNDPIARFGVLWREPGLSRSKPSWEPPGNIHRAKFSPKDIMRKMKKYLGIRPDGENFQTLGEFTDSASKSDWVIYEDVLTSDKWWLYKVVSRKPVQRKANYSMAYDPKTKRLTGKDLTVMAKYAEPLLTVFLKKSGLDVKYFGASYSESIAEMVANEVN